jgi:hypothetical protein
MAEHYTFANNVAGLEHALHTTLRLRARGFRTRLAVRQLTRMTRVCTVIATPPPRPNRAERGCLLRRSNA